MIVVGGHRQLDALSGDREHAFLGGGIAVAAEGQRVDVRVARHEIWRRDFPPNLKRHDRRFAGGDGDLFMCHAVLEPARGVHGVAARQHTKLR